MRRADVIAPEEIGAALRYAVQTSFGLGANDAVVEASRLLGFKRVGPDIQATFASVRDDLVERGVFEKRGEQLHSRS